MTNISLQDTVTAAYQPSMKTNYFVLKSSPESGPVKTNPNGQNSAGET